MGQLHPAFGQPGGAIQLQIWRRDKVTGDLIELPLEKWEKEESLRMTTRSTLLRNDNFIEAVVSTAHRKVIELSEEHIYFNGPDPQVMIHIWRKDGFYFSGTSERSYRARRRKFVLTSDHSQTMARDGIV